jgi:hypothetical protein
MRFLVAIFHIYNILIQVFRSYCSETTLTGESRFYISPPRGFEPVTLVAGSKQVSPLDQ